MFGHRKHAQKLDKVYRELPEDVREFCKIFNLEFRDIVAAPYEYRVQATISNEDNFLTEYKPPRAKENFLIEVSPDDLRTFARIIRDMDAGLRIDDYYASGAGQANPSLNPLDRVTRSEHHYFDLLKQEQHIRYLLEKYPALKETYDEYLVILALVKSDEGYKD